MVSYLRTITVIQQPQGGLHPSHLVKSYLGNSVDACVALSSNYSMLRDPIRYSPSTIDTVCPALIWLRFPL